MRHWLRGAMGAVVVYLLIWHYTTAGAVPPAPALGPPAAAPAVSSAGNGAPDALTYEPEAPERHVASHTVSERVLVAGTVQPTREPELRQPELPKPPAVAAPNASVAAPPELNAAMPDLKELLERVADVQQHAHNPAELDKQVQAFDEDPAKLAKLKALAELFVQLPTPREDGYMPSSTAAGAATAR